MSAIATAIVGGAVVGGVAQSRAASRGARAQERASELGIEEQRRQFDLVQELLRPYAEGGELAFNAQGDLTGLNGPEAEAAAIENIKNSPEFLALTQQGENAILQNASATGGLRGGNIQGALAQFRPQVLSNLISQRFGRLQGISGLGQASAAGVGAAGQQTGANVANLLADQGAAIAGRYQAQGQAVANVADAASTFATLKALKAF